MKIILNKLIILVIIGCAVACQSETKTAQEAVTTPAKIYDRVEIMPRFPGCEEEPVANKANCASSKMFKFIRESIKYPEKARQEKIEDRAVVSFIIQQNGKISDVTIVKDPGSGMGEEAKRIIESMPDWIPGIQEGEKVAVRYILPVKFKL